MEENEIMDYFGFKERLCSFHTLRGHVDFRESSQDTQPTVLSQLSCCCLPEDQEELENGKKDISFQYYKIKRQKKGV